MKPVAVFAATRWELRALRSALPTVQPFTIGGVRCLIGEQAGQSVWFIQTGVGPESAATAAAAVMDRYPMGSAISAGFACGLIRARIGDLMTATDVRSVDLGRDWVMDQNRVACDQTVMADISAAAQQASLPITSGRFISAPIVIWRASEKRRLSRLSGAIALDMESSALGAVAARCGIPFGIVRAVSDLVDEDLPLDFNLFLRPTGWLRGMRSLVTHPSSFVELNRLRKQSRAAADQLTELFVSYITRAVQHREAMPS